MNVIVNIENKNIGTESNSVNARELHAVIEPKSRFNDWIKNRLSKYEFIENQDYIKIITKIGNATAYDYFITLDVAKELCMVENNEKGREARRYFIEAEKQLQNNPTNKNIKCVINGYKSQLVQNNKSISRLQNRIQALATENEKLKVNNIKFDTVSNQPTYTREDIINLISKGCKYDKLLQDYYKVYEKYDSIRTTLKLAYPQMQLLMNQIEKTQLHISK